MCTGNCNQGRTCTCRSAAAHQMTGIERRLSDWGVLDETHQEHDPSPAEVDSAMTPGSRLAAQLLRQVLRFGLGVLTAAVVVSCIAGCGGGDDTDQVEHPNAGRPDRRIAVLIIGDSTMTPTYQGAVGTPARIASAHAAWSLTNAAVPGTTSCDAPLHTIRAAKADVVVANYGINDAYTRDGTGTRTSPQTYATCLRAIAAAAADAGSQLVMVQANPILPSPGWDTARLDDYERIKRASGTWLYCPQPAIRWTAVELPDGMHPSDAATPAISDQIARCISTSISSQAA